MRIPPLMTLDPALADFEHESCVINQIFDGLVDLDQDHIPNPALASYWRLAPDRKTYVFFLQPTATFHNGKKVSAEDVIYTFERILGFRNEKSTARDLLLQIAGADTFVRNEVPTVEGLRAIDELTLEIRLERQVANFPTLLANDGLGIVPKPIEGETPPDHGRTPIGTGPFRFVRGVEGLIVLEKNEEYFGKSPHLDRIELHLSEDPFDTSTRNALVAGTLDFVPCDPTKAEAYAEVASLHHWDNSLMYLGCNVSRDPIANSLVRQAIAFAIDRSRLVEADLSGLEPSRSLIPRGLFGYSLEQKAPRYNPDKARELLAQAGFENPEEDLGIVHLWSLAHSGLEDCIQEDLKAIGIRCRLRIVHFSAYEKALKSSRTSLFLLPFAFSLADGSHMLRRLFHTDGGYNLFSFSNPEIDQLFDSALSVPDTRERFEQTEDIQRELLSELPVIPLLLTRNTYAATNRVHGLTPGPFGLSSIKLEYAWLAPE